MTQAEIWDGARPLSQRRTIERRSHSVAGLSLAIVREDIRTPTDWCFEDSHHTLVVHLAGRLRSMESVFSRGPSARRLPLVGDIWAIPAGCRYAALAQGGEVRFAEFQLEADRDHDRGLHARMGHRDAFLYQAVLRAAELAERGDDLADMSLRALLEALRWHLVDRYLGAGKSAVESAQAGRYSARQCERLVDFVHASLAQPLTVDAMADVVGGSAGRFSARFRASFGITPWQFVLKARLELAQRLLRETRLPVTDIAAHAGFASPSHLTTSFVRCLGTTPLAFRQACW